MGNYRKINYYKWDVFKGCYRYVASTNAYRTLVEASYHMPKLDQQGNLIYFPRDCHPPSITPAETLNMWRVGYADSLRWYDAASLVSRDQFKKRG